VLLDLVRQSPSPDRKIELIWAIRHTSNKEWINEELNILQRAQKYMNLKIRIFATRDPSEESSPSSKEAVNVLISDEKDAGQDSPNCSTESQSCGCESETPVKKLGGETEKDKSHPNLHKMIPGFLDDVVRGPTTVIVSGPGGMISDVRGIIASCSSGSKVWRGQDIFDVRLVCDDRLEW
jgi:ferric-chelate reductase